MPPKQVLSERQGRVQWVRLDNPPRNFMTAQMVRELDDLTRELEEDPAVGAVIVTSAVEGVFITHYDVREIVAGAEGVGMPEAVAGGAMRAVGAVARVPGAEAALGRTPAAGMVGLRRIHELFLRMNRMDKVFVAAINGLALGSGCELALACDVRLMADRPRYRIGLPEASLGIIPGAGGTQRLTRALGSARALELMLEARPLPPAEAAELGLVHHLVAPERLLEEARTTAERLARRSPLSVRAIKRSVYEGGSRPLPDGLQLERAAFLACSSSPQAVRAMRRYVEELETLPPERRVDEELFAGWREGTAVDLTA